MPPNRARHSQTQRSPKGVAWLDDGAGPQVTPSSPSAGRILTLALAASSGIVALGTGEGAIRLAGLAPTVVRIGLDDPHKPFQVSDNPILAYELKPDFGDRFRTNSRGLQGPDIVIPKPPGLFRIALVGDSVVEGYGPERQEDTIGSQLQQTLRANFEVVSAGVRGYNTRAEVELFRMRVLPYDPDLVVLVFVKTTTATSTPT